LAERHGVHRRAVRQALASALVPVRRTPVGRPAPKLGEYRELIDEWLIADRDAPRKQRHTAKRIWRRLVDEHGVDVAETTVRDRVRKRRRELGLSLPEVFVPQVHAPGQTGEVDWGQAEVELAGARTRVHLFVMRSCFSGAAFSMASPVETQQAFLEGHAEAFAWFGGVFCELRYDNLTSAVKQVLKGRRRVESDRFVAMRSHYLFESLFTTPGIRGAHEKGGVEGEVGRFRRSHLVPVPQVGSFEQLNAMLRDGCERDLGRRIAGRPVTVAEQLAVERPLLRTVAEPFDATETAVVRVDAKALVTVRQNATRSQSRWPACASARGSARPLSRSATRASWSPATSGCTAASAPRRRWITTSSCWRASRAGLSARCRWPRPVSAAPGRAASTSSGRRSPTATALRTLRGRWSTL
jgi:transposase